MRRIIAWCLVVLILLVMGAVGLYLWKTLKSKTNENTEKDFYAGMSVVEIIDYKMSKVYPTEVFWYGEMSKELPTVKVKKLENISEATLKPDSGFRYFYIVLNDIDGNLHLSDEDWDVIFSILESDSRYSLGYLGGAKMDAFVKKRYIDENEESQGITFIGMLSDTIQPTILIGRGDLFGEANGAEEGAALNYLLNKLEWNK